MKNIKRQLNERITDFRVNVYAKTCNRIRIKIHNNVDIRVHDPMNVQIREGLYKPVINRIKTDNRYGPDYYLLNIVTKTTIVNHKNNSMENQEVLKFTWKKGIKEVKPVHQMVQNWVFTQETEEQASLAHYMAVVAEKNGLTVNDLQHLFPAVLRMLKDSSNWSK